MRSSCPKPGLAKSLFAADDNAYGGLIEWLRRDSRLGLASAKRPLFDSDDNADGGLLEWLARGDSDRHPRWL